TRWVVLLPRHAHRRPRARARSGPKAWAPFRGYTTAPARMRSPADPSGPPGRIASGRVADDSGRSAASRARLDAPDAVLRGAREHARDVDPDAWPHRACDRERAEVLALRARRLRAVDGIDERGEVLDQLLR